MESVLTNESEIGLNKTIETLHNLRVAHTGWQEILDEFNDLNPCCLQRVPAPRAPAHDFSAA